MLAFDNDAANDWAFGLDDVGDLSLVTDALTACDWSAGCSPAQRVICEALAACEVLARAKGQPGYHDAYTERVDAWVEQYRPDVPAELLKRAVSVVDDVRRQPSGVSELWKEAGMLTDWWSSLDDLRRRLESESEHSD